MARMAEDDRENLQADSLDDNIDEDGEGEEDAEEYDPSRPPPLDTKDQRSRGDLLV